jgi:hypothetical protein
VVRIGGGPGGDPPPAEAPLTASGPDETAEDGGMPAGETLRIGVV